MFKAMKPWVYVSLLVLIVLLSLVSAAQQPPLPVPAAGAVRTFASPQAATDALIAAAETFDAAAVADIFGSAGKDILVTAEPPHDRDIASTFAHLAREKTSVSIDPRNSNHAVILVGPDDWPFAVPLVKENGRWSFDTAAGIRELAHRRVGGNELDVIDLCHGFVEAQQQYALEQHGAARGTQYARRIISTPGTRDGLAWRTADGTWEGTIGENVARAIEKGYADGLPYHGYYFKVLTRDGAAGFALVAAPAQYAVTGVKTFMVDNAGVVYERDLGDSTLEVFNKMDRFNPDAAWTPVKP